MKLNIKSQEINKWLIVFVIRPGATRELVNALSQPHVQNIYRDLVYKIESLSSPTSPISSPIDNNGNSKAFFNGNGMRKNVDPNKIG